MSGGAPNGGDGFLPVLPVRKSLALTVADQSMVGEARRLAATLAWRLGYDEGDRGTVALVVTELAGNVLKHAGHGELLLRAIARDGALGVEVLALDRGPGIPDVARALRDGYSTAGTAGTGLGAVGRLAARFDIHSAPGLGTAVVAECFPRRGTPAAGVAAQRPAIEWAVLCLAKPGEEACGDDWALVGDEGAPSVVALVADGLGHGAPAADASAAAVRALDRRLRDDGGAAPQPDALVQAIHEALRGTRGAAVAVARAEAARGVVRYAGAGNIAGTIVAAAGTQSLVSLPGIVGHEIRKVQPFEYAWPRGALLVLASDGLGTHWRMSRYPGLATRHPALVAGVLYRDCSRRRDDVTVLVLRNEGAVPDV